MAERLIAISHRTKKTIDGEARPTIVVIAKKDDPSDCVRIELETEQDEIDFVFGAFPVTWKNPSEGDEIKVIPERHRKTSKIGADVVGNYPEKLLMKDGKQNLLVTKIPEFYEGLRPGDEVLMSLGGSGDNLAFALSQKGEEIGAKVFRVPNNALKAYREKENVAKGEDVHSLIGLYQTSIGLFYQVTPRERDLVLVRELFRARVEVMGARIGCEQRLRQVAMTRIYTKLGDHPAVIETEFDSLKANDAVFAALVKEESARIRELGKALEKIPVYTEVLSKVEGIGPLIAARIITSVGDIRTFRNDAAFKAFCGLHVFGKNGERMKKGDVPPDSGGVFPRKRRGIQCNWNPTIRQAFFLVADQFNRRPKSVWGEKLLTQKAKFRLKHPEKIQEEVPDLTRPGKMKKVWRYNDGHILKMAQWRTVTKFAEWLYGEWRKLERQQNSSQPHVPSAEKAA